MRKFIMLTAIGIIVSSNGAIAKDIRLKCTGIGDELFTRWPYRIEVTEENNGFIKAKTSWDKPTAQSFGSEDGRITVSAITFTSTIYYDSRDGTEYVANFNWKINRDDGTASVQGENVKTLTRGARTQYTSFRLSCENIKENKF